jgi:hypothetical protein
MANDKSPKCMKAFEIDNLDSSIRNAQDCTVFQSNEIRVNSQATRPSIVSNESTISQNIPGKVECVDSRKFRTSSNANPPAWNNANAPSWNRQQILEQFEKMLKSAL